MAKGKKITNSSRILLQGLTLGLVAFILTLGTNASLEKMTQRIPLHCSIPLFFFVIALGVITDGLGIASARAKEKSILSMASRKVRGAKEALWFLRNAPKVSSVFNDVMGDVAATLSGALAIAMIYRLRSLLPSVDIVLLGSVSVGLASSLTVAGKALFKPFALKHAECIVLFLGKIRHVLLRVFKRR